MPLETVCFPSYDDHNHVNILNRGTYNRVCLLIDVHGNSEDSKLNTDMIYDHKR